MTRIRLRTLLLLVAGLALPITVATPYVRGWSGSRAVGFVRSNTPIKLARDLGSRPFLARVLADPVLDRIPALRGGADPEAELRNRLKIAAVPGTFLVSIALKTDEPAEGTAIVDQIIAASYTTGATPATGKAWIERRVHPLHGLPEILIAALLALGAVAVASWAVGLRRGVTRSPASPVREPVA